MRPLLTLDVIAPATGKVSLNAPDGSAGTFRTFNFDTEPDNRVERTAGAVQACYDALGLEPNKSAAIYAESLWTMRDAAGGGSQSLDTTTE